MEEGLPEMRRARQDRVLLTWMRSLPAPVVRRSPVLSIVASWSLLMSGDLDGAESRLDDAEAALAAGARDRDLAATWADTEDLRTAPATVFVYRASLAQARGDVAGTVRHARRALDLAGPEDHVVRGAGGGFLGLAAWASGNVDEALSTFSDAVRSLHAAGNLVDELDSTVVLADMWLAAGRPSRARRLYEQALQTATAGGAPYPRATADLHVGLAELDRELDDLTSAQAHLESAQVLGERASITENRHRWYVVMAQVRAAGGDHETATRLLGQAEALYRRGFYPELRPIAASTARVRIAAGDLSSATRWADERAVGVDDEPDYLREYEHLTLARLLLARHRAGERSSATAVLRLLDRLHAAAVRAGRAGSVREIRMLQALAHHADGDLVRSLAALDRSLVDTPEPDGCVRLYLDEGVPMLALLQHATRSARARRLLDRARSSPETPQPPDSLLSQRELEVLRLLDSDRTGPEIARELYVTLNTLRTHTKRIFTKLDVTTRAAAVHRAREQGLL
jgi:LuxR family maltose regulon positive regulatory protein